MTHYHLTFSLQGPESYQLWSALVRQYIFEVSSPRDPTNIVFVAYYLHLHLCYYEMTDFYIPPKEISFRLLGYVSQYVLVSRTHNDPQVFHHPKDSENPDQYFQLIPGTGQHAGYYLIKSKYTGKVLFSRLSPSPRVGHIDGSGQYGDNWFQVEVGKGQYTQNFRLRNFASDTVLFSRTHANPQVYNHPASDSNPDQYFTFLFEDMKVDKVEYHLNLGKILSSIPIIIANQTLQNDSSIDQEMAFELDVTETHTSTFEYTTGFTITYGATFKAGVPLVAEAEFKVDTSLSQEWKFGTMTEFGKSYVAKLPVKAPPHTTVRAVSSVNRGDIEVPFTIYLSSKATGFQVQTHGIFRGVSTWDLRHTVSTQDLK